MSEELEVVEYKFSDMTMLINARDNFKWIYDNSSEGHIVREAQKFIDYIEIHMGLKQ